MTFADEVVETLSTVRVVGLNNVMRSRLEMVLSAEGYSPSYMKATFADVELVQAAADDLGWDYVMNMFYKEGTK